MVAGSSSLCLMFCKARAKTAAIDSARIYAHADREARSPRGQLPESRSAIEKMTGTARQAPCGARGNSGARLSG
jgi:hypothetical protein